MLMEISDKVLCKGEKYAQKATKELPPQDSSTSRKRHSFFVFRIPFFQTKNGKRDQTIRSNFQTFIFVIWFETKYEQGNQFRFLFYNKYNEKRYKEVNFVFVFCLSFGY